MASAIESMFVVIEQDSEGNEGLPYLSPDLSKLAKKYAPHVKPGHFEERVLKLDPWTFGVSVRRATKADAKDFQEDEDLLGAVHEYTNLAEYIERRKSELADTILFNAYEQVKDRAGLERFLEKTKLTTSQLEALNRKSTDAVNAPDEWLDIFAELVASKATKYKNAAGETTQRTKDSVIADWRG